MKIDTPDDLARSLTPNADPNSDADCARVGMSAIAIKARDAQITAWCEEKAKEAEKTVMNGDGTIVYLARNSGKASALRSLAAILRGSPA